MLKTAFLPTPEQASAADAGASAQQRVAASADLLSSIDGSDFMSLRMAAHVHPDVAKDAQQQLAERLAANAAAKLTAARHVNVDKRRAPTTAAPSPSPRHENRRARSPTPAPRPALLPRAMHPHSAKRRVIKPVRQQQQW